LKPSGKLKKEDKYNFDEEGVKFSSWKSIGTGLWSGICFLLNLRNGWYNPAWKIEHFTANSEKILPDLAANQLKWQHC